MLAYTQTHTYTPLFFLSLYMALIKWEMANFWKRKQKAACAIVYARIHNAIVEPEVSRYISAI